MAAATDWDFEIRRILTFGNVTNGRFNLRVELRLDILNQFGDIAI